MKPSLDDLALLVTIADQGSFTAAANALGLPKSTVSRRLAELEMLLRTSLFRRSTRSLSLTDEGQRIYDMAKPSIAAADNAARAIAERERLVAGRVSLTTTAAFGQYLIAPHLIRLIASYPGVQINSSFHCRHSLDDYHNALALVLVGDRDFPHRVDCV